MIYTAVHSHPIKIYYAEHTVYGTCQKLLKMYITNDLSDENIILQYNSWVTGNLSLLT